MKYIINKYNLKIWVLFTVSIIVACIALPNLPNEIPMHFNIAGEIDNYGNKYMIFLAPIIIFIFLVIAEICPRIDPKKENYNVFENYFYQIIFLVGLVMLAMQGITIAAAFGKDVHISTIMPVMLGIMFMFIGNIMPKFKHNYTVGIRTSWTLENEQVWYETHRLAGKVWVIGGLLVTLTALLPSSLRIIAFISLIILLVIIPIAFSYITYIGYKNKQV